MKRVTQRYLVASGGFAVAAWLSGVGLVSGFACLLAFALTAFVVGVVQRRQQVVESGRARRSGSGRSHRQPRVVDKRDSPRSTHRSRPSRVLNDVAEVGERPQLADYGW